MITPYNQMKYYKFFLIDQFITVLKTSHQKYTRIHVVNFLGGAPPERNLEMFSAIVKIIMLFDEIITFAHFTTVLMRTGKIWYRSSVSFLKIGKVGR